MEESRLDGSLSFFLSFLLKFLHLYVESLKLGKILHVARYFPLYAFFPSIKQTSILYILKKLNMILREIKSSISPKVILRICDIAPMHFISMYILKYNTKFQKKY